MPSTSAPTAPRLPGRAAGAVALACLALCAGRAPAQPAAPSYARLPTPAPAASLAPPRPAPVPDLAVQQAALQQPPPALPAGADNRFAVPEEVAPPFSVTPPGPERIFRLESEANLFERIRQEDRRGAKIEPTVFPPEPVLSQTPYYGRRWPKLPEVIEPNYVCYDRLIYEQKNFERGGWDLGVITPVVSALEFYGDFITMPYQRATDVCRGYECSAGYCLPGDPTPLLLYPHEPSVSGGLAEVAAVAAVVAFFP